MLTVNNISTLEFGKTNQLEGSTGVVTFPIHMLDGAMLDLFPSVGYDVKKYAQAGVISYDSLTNAIKSEGSVSNALLDMEGIGALLVSMFGEVTPTDLTGAYKREWSAVAAGFPIVLRDVYSSASNSSHKIEKCIVSSLTLQGQNADADGGKMNTSFNFAGYPTPGQTNPSGSTIDIQDIVALGNVSNRESVIELDYNSSVQVDLEDYATGSNVTINRAVEHAQSSIGNGVGIGNAIQSPIPEFKVEVPFDVISNGGDPSQPPLGILGFGWGSATEAMPSAYSGSKEVTATYTVYGQETPASGVYFEFSIIGTAYLEQTYNVNDGKGTINIIYKGFPTTLRLVNTTASYAKPT